MNLFAELSLWILWVVLTEYLEMPRVVPVCSEMTLCDFSIHPSRPLWVPVTRSHCLATSMVCSTKVWCPQNLFLRKSQRYKGRMSHYVDIHLCFWHRHILGLAAFAECLPGSWLTEISADLREVVAHWGVFATMWYTNGHVSFTFTLRTVTVIFSTKITIFCNVVNKTSASIKLMAINILCYMSKRSNTGLRIKLGNICGKVEWTWAFAHDEVLQ